MLSRHPANLLLRFLMEITALVLAGQWAWQAGSGAGSPAMRIAITAALPLLMAALWGIFRTPGDPFGKETALVSVPGWLRLSLEVTFFGFAVWSAFARGQSALGLAVMVALLLHYFWSFDRVLWLLRQR